MLLDGKSIAEYDSEFIHEKIGYVGQESFVVSGTLRYILDPREVRTDKEIQELMNEFKLDIARFDRGLDTYIGENHRNLSGGEFQKISLIRVFIEEKKIYLLDEPTSAMDSESEDLVCDILCRKLKGKTAIVITHRPSILKICTNVIKFHN